MEDERQPVHAVSQARGFRPVVEDMAEMAAAATAMHFGPRHAKRCVGRFSDRVVERLPEARPAGTAFEFRLGRIKRQATTGTGECALAMLLEQGTGERWLGAVLTQDVILLRRKLRPPFGIGLFDLELSRDLRPRRPSGFSPRPAEAEQARETGGGCEQDAAI